MAEYRKVYGMGAEFNSAGELSFARADKNPTPASLEAAAEKIRSALRELGADAVSE